MAVSYRAGEAMTVVRFQIGANVSWRVFRSSTSDMWIGANDDLGQVVQGSTIDELHRAINGLMNDLLLGLMQDDELDGFLRARGWRPVTPIPREIPEDGIVFDVPYATTPSAPPAYDRA